MAKNLGLNTMYHYTNTAGWKGINEGNPNAFYYDPRKEQYIDGTGIRGLWPNRRLVIQGTGSELVPFEATKPAIFGFPEELPKSWLEYEDCINIFDYLMSCCANLSDSDGKRSLVLLRVDLLPEDAAFVVDYLHIRHLAREFESEPDPRKKDMIRAEGNKKYWDSRIPLANYQGTYILPEVVVWTPIPQNRIHFVWEKDMYQFLDEAHEIPEAIAHQV